MDNQIYVKNIPISYDENKVEELFSSYGKIVEVHYPVDRKTNKPKGYAFVTFEESSSTQKALEKNSEEIEGQTLIIEIAKEKPAKKKKKEKDKE
jgi:RNA recognition motif-containing protein